MKNLLEIEFDTTIDNNLVRTWVEWENYCNTINNWVEFLCTLPYIQSVTVPGGSESKTIIEFESEEYKSWFVLRWS